MDRGINGQPRPNTFGVEVTEGSIEEKEPDWAVDGLVDAYSTPAASKSTAHE